MQKRFNKNNANRTNRKRNSLKTPTLDLLLQTK